MTLRRLSLRETQDLIANKPLALVQLEHSTHNKKIVVEALKQLWQTPSGQATFEVLRTFLRDVAPNYSLNKNQDGVRQFLLREMHRISHPAPPKLRRGLLAGVAAVFKTASL